MPDFLSVCMQDFLHRWQPELRERKQIIITIVSVKMAEVDKGSEKQGLLSASAYVCVRDLIKKEILSDSSV